MATKEQMEKVKDIVVKLRYLECMDNIITMTDGITARRMDLIMKGKSEHI